MFFFMEVWCGKVLLRGRCVVLRRFEWSLSCTRETIRLNFVDMSECALTVVPLLLKMQYVIIAAVHIAVWTIIT